MVKDVDRSGGCLVRLKLMGYLGMIVSLMISQIKNTWLHTEKSEVLFEVQYRQDFFWKTIFDVYWISLTTQTHMKAICTIHLVYFYFQ